MDKSLSRHNLFTNIDYDAKKRDQELLQESQADNNLQQKAKSSPKVQQRVSANVNPNSNVNIAAKRNSTSSKVAVSPAQHKFRQDAAKLELQRKVQLKKQLRKDEESKLKQSSYAHYISDDDEVSVVSNIETEDDQILVMNSYPAKSFKSTGSPVNRHTVDEMHTPQLDSFGIPLVRDDEYFYEDTEADIDDHYQRTTTQSHPQLMNTFLLEEDEEDGELDSDDGAGYQQYKQQQKFSTVLDAHKSIVSHSQLNMPLNHVNQFTNQLINPPEDDNQGVRGYRPIKFNIHSTDPALTNQSSIALTQNTQASKLNKSKSASAYQSSPNLQSKPSSKSLALGKIGDATQRSSGNMLYVSELSTEHVDKKALSKTGSFFSTKSSFFSVAGNYNHTKSTGTLLSRMSSSLSKNNDTETPPTNASPSSSSSNLSKKMKMPSVVDLLDFMVTSVLDNHEKKPVPPIPTGATTGAKTGAGTTLTAKEVFPEFVKDNAQFDTLSTEQYQSLMAYEREQQELERERLELIKSNRHLNLYKLKKPPSMKTFIEPSPAVTAPSKQTEKSPPKKSISFQQSSMQRGIDNMTNTLLADGSKYVDQKNEHGPSQRLPHKDDGLYTHSLSSQTKHFIDTLRSNSSTPKSNSHNNTNNNKSSNNINNSNTNINNNNINNNNSFFKFPTLTLTSHRSISSAQDLFPHGRKQENSSPPGLEDHGWRAKKHEYLMEKHQQDTQAADEDFHQDFLPVVGEGMRTLVKRLSSFALSTSHGTPPPVHNKVPEGGMLQSELKRTFTAAGRQSSVASGHTGAPPQQQQQQQVASERHLSAIRDASANNNNTSGTPVIYVNNHRTYNGRVSNMEFNDLDEDNQSVVSAISNVSKYIDYRSNQSPNKQLREKNLNLAINGVLETSHTAGGHSGSPLTRGSSSLSRKKVTARSGHNSFVGLDALIDEDIYEAPLDVLEDEYLRQQAEAERGLGHKGWREEDGGGKGLYEYKCSEEMRKQAARAELKKKLLVRYKGDREGEATTQAKIKDYLIEGQREDQRILDEYTLEIKQWR